MVTSTEAVAFVLADAAWRIARQRDTYRIALEEIRDRDNLDAAAMKAIAAHALAK